MCLVSADPLAVLLLMMGGCPLWEAKRRPWYRKVHPVGVFFSTLQLSMTMYAEYRLYFGPETTSVHGNNVMNVSTIVKKTSAILIPFVYCASKIIYVRYLEQLHEKTELFDGLIRSQPRTRLIDFSSRLKPLRTSIFRIRSGVVGGLLLFLPLNVLIGMKYTKRMTKQNADFWFLYYFQMPMMIFIVTALHIALQLLEIHRRLEFILQMEQSLLSQIIAVERENLRIISMFD